MADLQPPSGTGPLARREARLAWGLLLPTITAVALVVLLPLLAIFWISECGELIFSEFSGRRLAYGEMP